MARRDFENSVSGNRSRQTPEAIYPWLAPTRTSENGEATTREDMSPYHVFWGMPRRIRLKPPLESEGSCSICQRRGSLVDGFFLRHGGMNYEGAWVHPLTPYSYDEAGMPAPLHMPRRGLGYRNWPALVTGREERKIRREPAITVRNALRMARGPVRRMTVIAFGYDVDNAKIRGWYDHRTPAYGLVPEAASSLRELATAMVTAADEVASNLRSALKAAWSTDKSPEFAVASFWHETEPVLLGLLDRLVEVLGDDEAEVRILREWHQALCNASEALFESLAEAGDIGEVDPGRVARAHLDLKRLNWKGTIRNALRLPEKDSGRGRGNPLLPRLPLRRPLDRGPPAHQERPILFGRPPAGAPQAPLLSLPRTQGVPAGAPARTPGLASTDADGGPCRSSFSRSRRAWPAAPTPARPSGDPAVTLLGAGDGRGPPGAGHRRAVGRSLVAEAVAVPAAAGAPRAASRGGAAMFMSRITLSPLASLRDLAAIARADAYADHRLVWSFFRDEDRERSFLFRRLEHSERPAFLVVSPVEPPAASPAWIVETKPYEPRFSEGQRLAFSLRANPVVRRRTGDGRQRRDDVVMDAKRRFKSEHPDEPVPMAALIREAGVAWLTARAGRLGFAIDPGLVRCEGYRQHRLARRGTTVRFSTVDLQGILRVTDPERFVSTLYQGIGPSKAFGCGLLLVRRT